MDLASRPIAVVAALFLICIPIIYTITASFQPIILLIFLPSLFVLYRVWMRDNVARWFASFLVALVICGVVYSTWKTEMWRRNGVDATTKTVTSPEARDIRPYQYAMLACYAVGLVLLNVPSSHRWFTENDSADA